MAHSEILEPFERMLAEAFTSEIIRAIEAGGDWQSAWTKVEASGFLDALAPESQEGFGLDWKTASALFQALGRAAKPLPIGETMVLRAYLQDANKTCPDGPLIAEAPSGSLAAHRNSGAPGTPVSCEGEDITAQLAFLYAAQIAGAASRVLDMSVAYANEREQFGKPIGRQQAVQQQLAVMAEEAVAVRLAVENAVGGGSAPDFLSAASAKTIASRYAASIAAIAHAVHGAIGISAEYDLQLYTKRLQAWRLAQGAEAHWDEQIGRAVLANQASALDWMRFNLHS
ncbi:acyl-CoA dehydrogenase [Altererythrobacter sp. JGD-16]|uniref:Acyl-CoA dehydrogenase n=2 Tax=Altererythrobacter lutimaris TaxID=2743979 RepID=A0A850H753_9SPHN|nr:acyl-CoA dehydrogenase [Altererythrobacter lutimaris]